MSPTSASRRDFLTTAAAAGTMAAVSNVHAAGSDMLRVGLIGCGDRGTGAATQALCADPHVKLVAMADVFADRLEKSLEILEKDAKVAGKLDVRPDRRFVGFDAYRELLDSGVDVVLLCTPPHFRPRHLQAAVEAGKHVFAEKPVAVDVPGVHSVLATCELAKKKGLSVVSGLCLRYDNGFREAVRRIQDGAIGEIVTLFANDYRSGRWAKPRQPDWSDMLYQMRNWYNFTWLSGDFNVEQHVHYPRCLRLGDERPIPRQGRRHGRPAGAYRAGVWANLRSFLCRLRVPRRGEARESLPAAAALQKRHERPGDRERGGRPSCRNGASGVQIKAKEGVWTFAGPQNQMYQTEHDELFASIRNGKPINNGEYMARSTLLAIMGRMAAYTGQEITWEMAQKSKENLSPSRYAWDAQPPAADIAVPGQTRFV